jgi:DHA2 family multidrug resistance protein
MQALDTTIANVALPHMQGSLSATSSQINWVLTSYIVAAAIMTPATSILESWFGRRKLFMFSIAGFVLASMLCGTSTSLSEIVIFRLLQGIFGAPLVPLAQATLLDTYPESKRGQAMAIFGLGVMLGPILGPTLGGWLTENYNWRWVFYVNVPVGALALMLALAVLPDSPREKKRLDWLGFASLGLAVASLQVFLDRGEQLDWFASREIMLEFAIFITGLWIFVVHTAFNSDGFVDRRLFFDRNFVVGIILAFVVGAVLLATLSLLTPYLENLMDYPTMSAGLILAPRGLVTRVSSRYLLLSGFVLTAYALYEMSLFTPAVTQAMLIRTGILQGFGFGFVFVPLSTVIFATLEPELRTQGTAFYNLMRNIGSSVGISVVGYILFYNTQVSRSALVGYISPLERGVQLNNHGLDLTTQSGLQAVDQIVTTQATIISYGDCFAFMMYGALLSILLLPMLRQAK